MKAGRRRGGFETFLLDRNKPLCTKRTKRQARQANGPATFDHHKANTIFVDVHVRSQSWRSCIGYREVPTSRWETRTHTLSCFLAVSPSFTAKLLRGRRCRRWWPLSFACILAHRYSFPHSLLAGCALLRQSESSTPPVLGSSPTAGPPFPTAGPRFDPPIYAQRTAMSSSSVTKAKVCGETVEAVSYTNWFGS